MKKRILAALLAAVMAMSLAACGGSADSSDNSGSASDASAQDNQQTYELKVNWENNNDNFMTQNWDEWCAKITEKSGGRIQFTTYYNCSLLDSNAEMQQLMAGLADIADAKRTASDGFNISEKWKLLTAGVPAEGQVSLSYDFCEKFPQVMEEFDGVKVLAQSYTGGGGYQLLTTKKEVHSPADMAGMTIWCEPDWNGFVEACGATPVNTPWSEVYSSLQKNMYDGLMIAAETLKSCNFAEVCNFVTYIDFWYLSGPGYYMNKNTYEKLPDDLKAIIDDEALRTELEEANYQDGIELETTSIEWAEENFGTTVIYPTDEAKQAFLDKLTESKQSLAADLDAMGLPGSDMVSTIAGYAAEG